MTYRMTVGLGIGGLNPLEPYGMDVARIWQGYGGPAFYCNLDVGAVLGRGTPQAVTAAAQALIAMIETAQGYGRR